MWKEKVKMRSSIREVQDRAKELCLTMLKIVNPQKSCHFFRWSCTFVDYDVSWEASLGLEPGKAGSSSHREALERSWGAWILEDDVHGHGHSS